MMNIYRLIFFSFLGFFVCFISCNGQVKINLPKENATISVGQPKLNMTPVSSQNNVHCSLQDKKGNLWFGTTGDGVYLYDGKSFTNFTAKNGLNSNAISTILEDKKGNIWFGTDKGLSRFDGKIFRPIPVSNATYIDPFSSKPTTDYAVGSILEEKSGKIWLATNNGVYYYDGKTFTRFLANKNVINNNGLTLQLVMCMLEDKQGNIWFTTRTEGICRYDGKSITNYKPDNEEWFCGLLEDKNGNIWVGTRYEGVYRYDGKNFTKVLQNGRFDSCTVLSIIQDKLGNIWFGTEAGEESKRESEGGIWVYNGTSFKNFSKKDGLSNNAVWCLLEDKFGKLWIGTRNTGLCRFDGKNFTSFSEQ